MGCHLWGRTESDTTEATQQQQQHTLAKYCSKFFKLGYNVNQELLDVQAGFRKSRGTRDQIANIHWIIEKAREFQKKSTSASLTTPKLLTVWITTNWKILKGIGLPDHFTCLLRNLYAGQEATVRTRYGTTDWFKTGKAV